MSEDPTQRFTSRVHDYERYRPPYPAQVIDILQEECGLQPSHVIADIGSGTGLLSVVFLRNGNQVYGVEPNDAMRGSGESFLRGWPNFVSIMGRAEATTLPSGSVEFVSAASAFHWFDPERTRPEFVRILRPGGWFLVVSNRRRMEQAGLGQVFQELMARYGAGRDAIRRRFSDEALGSFFGPGGFGVRTCENRQILDWSGLQGLMRSYSSMPQPGQSGYDELMIELHRAFEEHEQNGQVILDYDTRICFGMLNGS